VTEKKDSLAEKIRYAVFDLEENEKWWAALPSLEKILDEESVVKIKASKIWAMQNRITVNDLLTLAENVGRVSDSMLQDMIYKLITKAATSYHAPEFSLNDLADAALPLVSDAVETKKQRRQGGANSHEMREPERRERNESMQKDIDELCLKKGRTFKNARVIVAKKYSLHPDTLKRIVKNPLT